MFSYYFNLGLRSLRRNMVLTALMIAAIAVGIGASMTTLTLFRAMSGDPISQKSGQLYTPQIDNWGNFHPRVSSWFAGWAPGWQLSYIDAMGLMKGHAAKRQSAMYAASLSLQASDSGQKPFKVQARAAYRDFFPMFRRPVQIWRSVGGGRR